MKSIKRIISGVFSIRHHFIMRMDINDDAIDSLLSKQLESGLVLTRSNKISDMIDGTYTVNTQNKIINSNKGLVDTFLLKKDDETIGVLSVIYKGGNELEYRIRTIEVFVYNVFIAPLYRGNGYAGLMLKLMASRLAEKEIDNVYLSVSADNNSAIKAYEKIGFKIVGEKTFVRLLRNNIPYYSL